MPTPEPQPKFFLDRSLGRVAVPALLRAAGWNLVTLAEHYGVPNDEQVADTTARPLDRKREIASEAIT